MDFRQLKTFLAVVDTGNITRAAEILYLVQPAVSRQIKLLEEDLGTSLFERQRRGMVPTEAGRKLVEYARRAILELDRARAAVVGAQNGIGGIVTLGLLPSTIDVLSGPLLSAIASKYPGIRLRLAMGYAGTLAKWLETGEVDAALLYGAAHLPHVKIKPLVEEPLWVVCPKNYKLKAGKTVSLKELAKHPVILPSTSHGIRTLMDHACAVADIQLQIAAEANSLSVQRSLVINGHGLSILPPLAVTEDLKTKQLGGAPLSSPSISRTIVLATPTNRLIGQHVQCVVELLTECVKNAVFTGKWTQGKWLVSN
jgi:DNA-binding transcriptional LysR family regulator